jgi:hypothetical protein
MTRRRHNLRLGLALVAAALVAALAGSALAARGMQSTKLGPLLCETTGGGKFVGIPGFPGEKIDRRLLADIRWLRKRYPIFITDGYSMSDVHSSLGEHPLGLALDIVPNEAEGGTWADITRLARWAERRQDRPRAPFRWVGYDGDSGHGRGHHLHLSWSHSETRPGRPATLIHTLRCPSGIAGTTQPPAPEPEVPPTGGSLEGEPPSPSDGRRDGRGRRGGRDRDRSRGHAGGGGGVGPGGGHGSRGGGVTAKLDLAPPAPETGGVGLR